MAKGGSTRALRLITVAVLVGMLVGTCLWAAPPNPSGTGTEIVKVDGIAFELVRIPAGRFRMGSDSGGRDERPVHEVCIAHEFYLGRTEVTVAQFRAFTEATGYQTDAEQLGWACTCPLPGLHGHERGLDWRRPGFEQQEDHPAVVLSWNDATAFCRWLSERTGRNIRLPTEAEWEYAARAGRRDDGLGNANADAWYDANAGDGTRPVRGKPANPWGLHDMQGNASEWCLDVWRPDYHGAALDGGPRADDPAIPRAAWRYVLRGGGWASPVEHLRYGCRHRGLASFANPATGLRIAWDPHGRMGHSVAPADSANDARPRARGQATLSTDNQTGETVLTTHGAQFEFVRVPAGEFLMGAEEGTIEKPVHRVRIGYDFEMATTEVTTAQFRAFVEATGYMTDGEKAGTLGSEHNWQSEEGLDWCHTPFEQSDEHPVSFISWYDAMAFCHWLSVETGQEIRLPSEPEWEYACRAGTTGAYAGPVNAMGWHRYNSGGRTHPVAQKQPNAWGLYDMHGNVWEWCLDFFTTSYEGAPTDGRPRWDLKRPSDVVSRGGSLGNPPGWLGSAVRMGSFPDCSHYNNGFRIVRVLAGTSLAPRRSSLEGASSRDRSRAATDEQGVHAGSQASRPRFKGETPSTRLPLAPVEVALPKKMFEGTPKDIRAPRTKPVQMEPGPPFLAPHGTRNVALDKPVSSSDEEPVIGELARVTDGDKEAADGSFVELGPLLQHITIDLQDEYEIYGIRVWHFHKEPRVYFDVVIQIADAPDFRNDVTTIFNNDMDNSSGLGVGTGMHYVDTHFGEIFDARGARGPYVRLYSRGNTANDLNHYIEVEVYGRPVAESQE